MEDNGTLVHRVRLSALSEIHERARGNPLFVGRLLEAAARTGALVSVANAWRFTSLEDVAPEGAEIGTLMKARLADLPVATRETMSIASLLGVVGVEVLAQAAAVSVERLYEDLRPARAAGLMSLSPRVRFTHDTVLEAARTLTNREDERSSARAVLLEAASAQVGFNTTFARGLLRAARDLEEPGCDDALRVDTRLALAEASLLEADFDRVDDLVRGIEEAAAFVGRPPRTSTVSTSIFAAGIRSKRRSASTLGGAVLLRFASPNARAGGSRHPARHGAPVPRRRRTAPR